MCKQIVGNHVVSTFAGSCLKYENAAFFQLSWASQDCGGHFLLSEWSTTNVGLIVHVLYLSLAYTL